MRNNKLFEMEELQRKQDNFVNLAEIKMNQFFNDNLYPIFKIMHISIYGIKLYIYIFYKKNFDLQNAVQNGYDIIIKEKYLSTLKELGYFNDYNHEVFFEFDSDENVQKHYEGSYFYRLR